MIFKSSNRFKKTEIGDIPIDWNLKKIKDVAKINELNLEKSYNCREINYIDISSVKERRILETRRVLSDKAPTRAKRIVRKNDILISTVRPNLKHFVFVTKSYNCLIASTGFAIISAKKANPQYLYYYLTSEYYTRYLSAIADTHTSTYPAFTPDVIETSLMPFPCAFEQEKVGKFLQSFDEKIQLNIQMNQTLESIGRVLFKHWFIDYEFPNETGKSYKTSGGKMFYSTKNGTKFPKGWKMGSIGNIVQFQAGYPFKSYDLNDDGTIGILKIKNITENNVDIKDTQYVSKEVVSNLDKRFMINSGSILIALTGANVGKIGIVPKTNKELWLNQRVAILKEKLVKGKFFIFFLLSSKSYQTILRNRALGTAQPNIGCLDIESLEIVIPPDDIIDKFGTFFEPLFQKIVRNLFENEILSELRNLLLPKLIFGQLRLN